MAGIVKASINLSAIDKSKQTSGTEILSNGDFSAGTGSNATNWAAESTTRWIFDEDNDRYMWDKSAAGAGDYMVAQTAGNMAVANGFDVGNIYKLTLNISAGDNDTVGTAVSGDNSGHLLVRYGTNLVDGDNTLIAMYPSTGGGAANDNIEIYADVSETAYDFHLNSVSLKQLDYSLVAYWPLDEVIDGVGVADKMDETFGSELITNGDLSNGTTGWYDDNNDTFEVVDGQLHAITSGSTWDGVRHQVTAGVTKGKLYKITFDYRVVSGTNISFYVFTNDTGTSDGDDSHGSVSKTLTATTMTTETRYWLATATNTTARISFVNGTAASREIYIDNLSVKEANGSPGVLL